MSLSPSRSTRHAAAGFTLAELLITLLVVSVGMLGLAKLEAAAVSESQVSRVRSLMSFQAESLASLMRANRAYWADTTATTFPSFTISSTGSVGPSTVSGATKTCMGLTVHCSTAELAYADLNAWAANYTTQFPGATASISCFSPGAGACTTGSNVPLGYDIQLGWNEKSVAVNRSGTAGTGTTSGVNMILHVQP
jgi:type IV pilus assembly protein PilV